MKASIQTYQAAELMTKPGVPISDVCIEDLLRQHKSSQALLRLTTGNYSTPVFVSKGLAWYVDRLRKGEWTEIGLLENLRNDNLGIFEGLKIISMSEPKFAYIEEIRDLNNTQMPAQHTVSVSYAPGDNYTQTSIVGVRLRFIDKLKRSGIDQSEIGFAELFQPRFYEIQPIERSYKPLPPITQGMVEKMSKL